MLLVSVLAFLPSVAGSVIVPLALGDTDGFGWLIFAPVGGFAGGMAAGFVIGRRHLAWLGFFVGVLGCAAAQVLAWAVFATLEGTAALWFFLGWGCLPFVVGCYLGAAVGAPSRGDRTRGGDGALWAVWETIKFFGFWT